MTRGRGEGADFKRNDGRGAAAFQAPNRRRTTLYGKTRADAAGRPRDAQVLASRRAGCAGAPERNPRLR